MVTVLVVEDEDTLRESLARYLELEGHEVLSAANGREAFDLGISGMPDVLVADWMLRNHIHGLHVAQTLRAVDPSLNTVLITGFPSRDLGAEFQSGGVLELLEKPFDLSDLGRAVDEAAASSASSKALVGAAVFEVEADGTIVFASRRARELLAETSAGAEARDFGTVIGADFANALDAVLGDWAEVFPLGAEQLWMLRTRVRSGGSGWLVAACRGDEPRWLNDPRLRILLDHHARSAPILPNLGPVIVLEQDGAVRRLLASQIERIGALCFLADDLESALRLIRAEPRAERILIDIELAGDALAGWVGAIHALRPGARIIGTGGSGSADDLLSKGLARILDKPWRIDELVEVLNR